MFIAHLPAGYLLTRRIARRAGPGGLQHRRLMAIGLLASVLPDFDMLYFYLVDNGRTLHHDYWTHLPAFWLFATGMSAVFFRIARLPVPWPAVTALLAGVMLHLALDSIAGGIAWLYPFHRGKLALIEVPARYGWWVWNFVFHWSFLLEIAILTLAVREAVAARNAARSPAAQPIRLPNR
jgi:inner membrane protein